MIEGQLLFCQYSSNVSFRFAPSAFLKVWQPRQRTCRYIITLINVCIVKYQPPLATTVTRRNTLKYKIFTIVNQSKIFLKVVSFDADWTEIYVGSSR